MVRGRSPVVRRWVTVATVLALAAGCAAVPAVQGAPPPATSAPADSAAPTSRPDGPTGDPAATTTPAPFPTPAITWRPCKDDGIECATLTVPLDHGDPSKGTIELAVQRRLAGDRGGRIGTLFVNPGGPGVGATFLVEQADLFFSPELLRRFDVLAWDPRGTGDSAPVDCVDDLDPFLGQVDPAPTTPAGRQALEETVREFGQACASRSGRLLPYVGTESTVRDMDLIRAALGEEQLSYLGFSYGSELGALYATLFPHRVRAMVLDGALNPNEDPERAAVEQTVALERTLDRFLSRCSGDRSCPFRNGGDAAGAFDRLFARLATDPLPAPTGRPPIGRAIGYWAVINALYQEVSWPVLASALKRAQDGDGLPLLRLYDAYFERRADGTTSNSYEALIAIRCVDDPGPQDPAFTERLTRRLVEVAPRLGAWAGATDACRDWPAPATPKRKVTAAGAGPVVVLANTADPITPIASSESLVADLEDGRLVRWEGGAGHTSYGSGSRCIDSIVDRYLVDLRVPDDGTVCR